MKNFDESTKLAVWRKGQIDQQYDSSIYRKDVYGSWMQYNQYGDRNAKFGWEIDHIEPESRGGGDELSNLQPLYWENNVAKGDS